MAWLNSGLQAQPRHGTTQHPPLLALSSSQGQNSVSADPSPAGTYMGEPLQHLRGSARAPSTGFTHRVVFEYFRRNSTTAVAVLSPSTSLSPHLDEVQ